MKNKIMDLLKSIEEIFPALALSFMFLFMVYGITKMLTVIGIIFL